MKKAVPYSSSSIGPSKGPAQSPPKKHHLGADLRNHKLADALVVSACRILEQTGGSATLSELSQMVGLSAPQLRRRFLQTLGVSPKDYAVEVRARSLRTLLSERKSVTEATMASGYGSSSRVAEKSRDLLGMTPSAFRQGGKFEKIHFTVRECSLGHVLVAQSKRGVCLISLGDEPQCLVQDMERRFDQAELILADKSFENTVAQVVALIEAPGQQFDLPLDIRGTAFQRKVWRALSKIPAGTTMTYAQIAETIGAPKAVRAVAGACGANSLCVVIPCHRVIRSDGTISGYRWGVERKSALLEREGVVPPAPKTKG